MAARSLLLAPSPSPREALPRGRAAPSEQACGAYGTGFRQIGEGGTCLRIGGSVRVETDVTTGGGSTLPRR